MRGNHIGADKALEECLKLTEHIDNNACLLDAAAASNARKTNARLSQEKYKVKQDMIKLEKRNMYLEEHVQKICIEKKTLDASLSSLFSDNEEDSQPEPRSQPECRSQP